MAQTAAQPGCARPRVAAAREARRLGGAELVDRGHEDRAGRHVATGSVPRQDAQVERARRLEQ